MLYGTETQPEEKESNDVSIVRCAMSDQNGMIFLLENQKQTAIENLDSLFIEQKTTVVQLKKEWTRFLDLANVESLSSMVVQLENNSVKHGVMS